MIDRWWEVYHFIFTPYRSLSCPAKGPSKAFGSTGSIVTGEIEMDPSPHGSCGDHTQVAFSLPE